MVQTRALDSLEWERQAQEKLCWAGQVGGTWGSKDGETVVLADKTRCMRGMKSLVCGDDTQGRSQGAGSEGQSRGFPLPKRRMDVTWQVGRAVARSGWHLE